MKKKLQITILMLLFTVNQNNLKGMQENSMEENKDKSVEFFLKNAVSFMLSRALYVAADLSIADILQEKPCTLAQLAQKTGSHESSLERLMNLLQLHNVFERDQDGNYCNTDLSQNMITDHPESMRPLLLHEDQTRWNCYGNLEYSIKTGKPTFDHLYGMPYFNYTTQNSLLNARFNEAMTTISQIEENCISKSFQFSDYATIADIGGGHGALLKKILKDYSSVQVILGDLPEVIADHQLQQEFAERFSVTAVNFFEPIILKADLYIMKRILHDWDDEQSVKILKNIAATMLPESRLLIIESLIGEQGEQAQLIAHIDLLLLAVFGGRERSLAEFKIITEAAGLTIMKVHKTDSLVSIIECCIV